MTCSCSSLVSIAVYFILRMHCNLYADSITCIYYHLFVHLTTNGLCWLMGLSSFGVNKLIMGKWWNGAKCLVSRFCLMNNAFIKFLFMCFDAHEHALLAGKLLGKSVRMSLTSMSTCFTVHPWRELSSAAILAISSAGSGFRCSVILLDGVIVACCSTMQFSDDEYD